MNDLPAKETIGLVLADLFATVEAHRFRVWEIFIGDNLVNYLYRHIHNTDRNNEKKEFWGAAIIITNKKDMLRITTDAEFGGYNEFINIDFDKPYKPMTKEDRKNYHNEGICPFCTRNEIGGRLWETGEHWKHSNNIFMN